MPTRREIRKKESQYDRFVRLGRSFGYPECCIQTFAVEVIEADERIARGEVESDSECWDRERVRHPTRGYIMCPSCLVELRNQGELAWMRS